MSRLPDNSLPAAEPGVLPVFCYVTDRLSVHSVETDSQLRLLARIRDAIKAGVTWVQIREKDLPGRQLLALVQAAGRCQPRLPDDGGRGLGPGQTKVIVNGRLDVAIAARAAGVHLGRESAPLSEVARWCRAGNAPPGFLIGASCHSVAEAREAESAGASYIVFGPIFDTPAKRVFGEPLGISQLRVACGAVKIPVLAIGGVDLSSARECLRGGAAGIAAIRLFQGREQVDELRAALDSLRAGAGNCATR